MEAARASLVDSSRNSSELLISSPVTKRDREEIGAITRAIDNLFAQNGGQGTLGRFIPNNLVLPGEDLIGYAFSHLYSRLGYDAVIGAWAKHMNQPVVLVAPLDSTDAEQIRTINRTLGKIRYNGELFDPILIAEDQYQAFLILRDKLQVTRRIFLTPVQGEAETVDQNRVFSQVVTFTLDQINLQMKKMGLDVAQIIERAELRRAVEMRIEQAA